MTETKPQVVHRCERCGYEKTCLEGEVPFGFLWVKFVDYKDPQGFTHQFLLCGGCGEWVYRATTTQDELLEIWESM
jgi:hypothetical protein